MIELSQNETRVIGSLMEKAVTTPDQYPLTLNALVASCNQKSSRDPVLSLDQGIVERTLNQLEERHLTTREEGFGSRVSKFTQRFCNTPFSDLKFSKAEYAIICVLLLRGPQTPGELRTRCSRLFAFRDNHQVEETLQALISPESGSPRVARLPQRSGRRDFEYAHLFSGEIESVQSEPVSRADPIHPEPASQQAFAPGTDRLAALESRLEAVEEELQRINQLLENKRD